MTLQDDGKFCFECNKIGLLRKAHRIVPKYGAACDEHYREHAGLPQITMEGKGLILRWKTAMAAAPVQPPETSEKPEPEIQTQPKETHAVPKQIDETVKEEIRKDWAAGMNYEQIRRKHMTSWITVKNIITAAGGANGHNSAKKSKASKTSKIDNPMRVISPTPDARTLLDKWNTEANEVFSALPLEKKAELLGMI